MSSGIRRWLREPIVQFLIAGLALFVVYDARHRRGTAVEPTRIELTEEDLRQLGSAWVAQGRPAPSEEELRALADARIREEVLYREALSLGLDRDDAIVRRRLAQKMEFLFEDVAGLRDPGADELRGWFEGAREEFALPGRVTFRHLYFSPDRRGDRAREHAARALEQVAGGAADSSTLSAVGDPFMFQDFYAERAPEDVAKAFGPAFAREVFRATPGAWTGPVESGYGWHLVHVESATPPRIPEFEEVEPEVRAAWIEAQRRETREKSYDAMRERYEVVLPVRMPAIERPGAPEVTPP